MKKVNPAKLALIELSKIAQAEIEYLEETEGVEISVNQWIVEHYKENTEIKEFNSYKGWAEKGFQVQKGSIAFRVWAKPRKVTKKEQVENIQTGSTEDAEKKYKFWGMASIFSDQQVERIEEEKAA
jgi:hypothetical protein